MLKLAEEAPIHTKVKELCQTIVDEQEFKEIQDDIQAFLGDEDAKAQYQAFAQKSEELHHRSHAGEHISEEEAEDYEGMRVSLFNNPIVSQFVKARESVNELQKMVQEYVGMTFEHGRMPVAEDFASESECCSKGGCGCK